MTPEERHLTYRPFMRLRKEFFLDEVPKGSTVLEVGCSSGYFLAEIQDDYTVYGNEWNPEDAAYVRDVGELPCEEGEIEDVFPGVQFTAICAYLVLEHQPDPVAWIGRLRNRMIRGGYLLIEVPNSEEGLLTLYDIPEYKDFWYRDCHPSNFNMSNLNMVMAQAGFEVKSHTRQTYGLLNHIYWLQNKRPMDDYASAKRYASPIPKDHSAAPYFNRWWSMKDHEYRLNMEAGKAGDTIVSIGRLREI